MYDGARGVTMYTVNVGLSTVTGISTAPFVLYSLVRQISGTSLFMSGIGTAHASMFVGGGVPLGTSLCSLLFVPINGPAAFQFAAGGASAVVSVIQGLSRTPDV